MGCKQGLGFFVAGEKKSQSFHTQEMAEPDPPAAIPRPRDLASRHVADVEAEDPSWHRMSRLAIPTSPGWWKRAMPGFIFQIEIRHNYQDLARLPIRYSAGDLGNLLRQ